MFLKSTRVIMDDINDSSVSFFSSPFLGKVHNIFQKSKLSPPKQQQQLPPTKFLC